jgi:gas vesicle protein
MRENNGYDFVYFMLGGLAGASLALLLTPRSGRETRQLVASRMRDGERVARRGIERGREVFVRSVQEGKHIAKRSLERGREAVASVSGASPSADPAAVEKLT